MNFKNFSQVYRGDRRIERIYLGDELVWVEGAAPPVPAPAITLSAAPASPAPGQTVTIAATVTGAPWTSVQWSTTGPALSGNGWSRTYTAGEGEATITATVTTDGGSASESVTITVSDEPSTAPTIALSYDAEDPDASGLIITADLAGTVHWLISTNATATTAQVLAGEGAASGSQETIPGVIGLTLPDLDGVTALYFHAVLQASGQTSAVASMKVQIAYVPPADGALATYDFTSGAFPAGVSVLRADAGNNVGSYINNAMRRLLSTANMPRVDYAGGRGLLLEPERKNYMNRSRGWGSAATEMLTISGNTTRVQNGEALLEAPGAIYTFPTALGGGAGFNAQPGADLGAVTGAYFVASIVLEAANGDAGPFRFSSLTGLFFGGSPHASCDFNPVTGEVVAVGGSATPEVAARQEAPGKWRITMKYVRNIAATGTGSYCSLGVSSLVAGGQVRIEELQLEINPSGTPIDASSHLVTTNSQLTRAAETLRLTEVFGAADVRVVLIDDSTIELTSQALDGDWGYTPATPLKVKSVSVYSEGAMP